jgi:hypothetical protein
MGENDNLIYTNYGIYSDSMSYRPIRSGPLEKSPNNRDVPDYRGPASI